MAIIKKTLALLVTLCLLMALLSAAEESSEHCDQQYQSQQQLKACGDYLRDSTQIGTEWREQFPRCCQLLERMDEQCRCHGIKKIVQQHQLQGEQLREMMRTAESLPRLCRMEPQRCDIGTQLLHAFSF